MLSDNIRNYRKANNMSQDELAEKLDVSRQSISLWENGQTQPTIENIVALSNLFNITADELLGNVGNSKSETKASAPKKKSRIVIIIIAVVLVVAGAVLFWWFGKNKKPESKKNNVDTNASETTPVSETGPADFTDEKEDDEKNNVNTGTSETAPASETAPVESAASDSQKTKSSNTSKSNTSAVTKQASAKKPAANSTPQKVKFDLFTYCKDFAIKKGKLNGDYTIYQQPSTLYGGYENEYFSISYWGDSNMVEFCLHCPLDDTYSINFYIRMRGGYSGKYEYSTSRYYRDTGESVRSAYGYIDPNVFSDNYPLNCSEYIGTTDKQNDFMEESRIGICDLIKCLKKFVEIENMDCGFDAFGFKNF